jgi:hypothetical protein
MMKPKIEFHHEGTKDAKKGKKNGVLSFLRALRAFVVNAFVCFTLMGVVQFLPAPDFSGTRQ